MQNYQPTPLWLHDVPQHPSVLISHHTRQLAELFVAGVAVPTGFVVPGDLFLFYLQQTGLYAKIGETVSKISPTDNQQLHQAAQKIQQLIKHTPLPDKAAKMLDKAFAQFIDHVGKSNDRYIIRAEFVSPLANHSLDLPSVTITTAAAFQKALFTTYLALFEATLLHSWLSHGSSFDDIAVSFFIQPALPVHASGVAQYTDSLVTVEAIYGAVTPFLTNAIKPDRYQVDTETFEIISHDINRQTWRLEGKHVTVPRIDQSISKLQSQEITGVAQLLLAAEKFTGCQSIIWQLDTAGRLWIDSVRKAAAQGLEANDTRILTGQPVVAGIVSGTIRLIHTKSDLTKLTAKDIAVIELADFRSQSFPKVAGIIAEAGHAKAALSRFAKQHGIPMILGSGTALHQLRNGLVVTLNGFTGQVLAGKVEKSSNGHCHHCNNNNRSAITGTKIYATIDSPTEIGEADGVMISSDQLYHQTETDSAKQSTDRLTALLSDFYGTANKPLIYQISDNSTSPFGYRGAIKHLHNPTQIKIELEALRRFEATHYAHAFIVLPAIRTQQEFIALQQLMTGAGLEIGTRTKLWLPCHTPATLFMLEQFVTEEMLSGIYIDLPELAQHTLGVDMSLKELANEYDLHDNAVMTALEHVTQLCREYNMPLTVRVADETSPELMEAVVALGATGLVVSAEDVSSTRSLIASTEQRIILDHAIAELHTEPEEAHVH